MAGVKEHRYCNAAVQQRGGSKEKMGRIPHGKEESRKDKLQSTVLVDGTSGWLSESRDFCEKSGFM